MKTKWIFLFIIVVLYVFGIIGIGWHTYDITDPVKASKLVEAIKMVFIAVGGLGVVLSTYITIAQSLESSRIASDKIKFTINENTFRILEKWDDASLLEARGYTREIKDKAGSLSPDEIKKHITDTPKLRQSIILLYNYFDLIRISFESGRVDPKIVKDSLGLVIRDICDRFRPWLDMQDAKVKSDVSRLLALLSE